MDGEYEKKDEQIRSLGNKQLPDFIAQLGRAQSGFDSVAPNIAPHLAAAVSNAFGFLHSKLPAQGQGLLDDNHVVPEAEKKKFMDYHNTVNDPVSTLDHIADGTLNHRHVEALQAAYPQLHQEMRSKLIRALAENNANGKSLPYHKRQAASLFLGQPLDSTMTPQSAQAIIASAGNQQAQHPQPKKPTGAQLKTIDKSDSMYATESQSRQINKRQ